MIKINVKLQNKHVKRVYVGILNHLSCRVLRFLQFVGRLQTQVLISEQLMMGG